MTEQVLCRLCGIPCDDTIAEMYHWFKDHWNWYAGLQRIKELSQLTIPQLEERQRRIDKFKKDSKKKK
jgi:hypothetical protein